MKPTLNEVYAALHHSIPLDKLLPIAHRTLLMYDPHTPTDALRAVRHYQRILKGSLSHEFPYLSHLAPIRHADQVNPVIQSHIQSHTPHHT